MSGFQLRMLVPLDFVVVVSDLDESNTSLGESAGHHAHSPEVRGHWIIHAVHFVSRLGLRRQVFYSRQLRLHAKRQFERLHACLQRSLGAGSSHVFSITLFKTLQLELLNLTRQTRVANKLHLRFGGGNAGIANCGALVGRREKRRTPIVNSAKRERRADRHECWQAGVLCSQSIADPRSHTWPHEVVAAGVEFHHSSTMSWIGSVHRMDHAEIIHMSRHFREQIADPQTALAVLTKTPRRLQQVTCRVKLDLRLGERKRLAIITSQQRLGIKCVDL